MPKIKVFLDSSALIAGIISAQGAARALLQLAEDEKIVLIVSEQVIVEIERNLARKAPKALPFAREVVRAAKMRIVRDPQKADVLTHLDWIQHAADVPILIAAHQAGVDYLATLNYRHFLDDPEVSRRSGLIIGTPGDVLGWVRSRFASDSDKH